VDLNRPIFIGGVPRSGATFVADLLGLHPNLSPVYDTPFVTDICLALFVRRSAAERAELVWGSVERWLAEMQSDARVSPNGVDYHHGTRYALFSAEYLQAHTQALLRAIEASDPLVAFQSFVNDLFGKHGRLDGKPLWINKTSTYVDYAPLLKAVFPNMLFVHVVRDGRDVAVDMVREQVIAQTHPEAMTTWCRSVREGVVFGRACPESYVEIRFEDLLANPEVALGRVLDRLGESGASGIVSKHHNAGGSFDLSRCGLWEDAMEPDEAALIGDRYGAALATLGSSLDAAISFTA
jgi:hypothetical protein